MPKSYQLFPTRCVDRETARRLVRHSGVAPNRFGPAGVNPPTVANFLSLASILAPNSSPDVISAGG